MTVTDQIVQVPPDSTGKMIDNSELTVGSNTVERQRVNVADPSDAAGLSAVLAGHPAADEYGQVVRVVGQQEIGMWLENISNELTRIRFALQLLTDNDLKIDDSLES